MFFFHFVQKFFVLLSFVLIAFLMGYVSAESQSEVTNDVSLSDLIDVDSVSTSFLLKAFNTLDKSAGFSANILNCFRNSKCHVKDKVEHSIVFSRLIDFGTFGSVKPVLSLSVSDSGGVTFVPEINYVFTRSGKAGELDVTLSRKSHVSELDVGSLTVPLRRYIYDGLDSLVVKEATEDLGNTSFSSEVLFSPRHGEYALDFSIEYVSERLHESEFTNFKAADKALLSEGHYRKRIGNGGIFSVGGSFLFKSFANESKEMTFSSLQDDKIEDYPNMKSPVNLIRVFGSVVPISNGFSYFRSSKSSGVSDFLSAKSHGVPYFHYHASSPVFLWDSIAEFDKSYAIVVSSFSDSTTFSEANMRYLYALEKTDGTVHALLYRPEKTVYSVVTGLGGYKDSSPKYMRSIHDSSKRYLKFENDSKDTLSFFALDMQFGQGPFETSVSGSLHKSTFSSFAPIFPEQDYFSDDDRAELFERDDLSRFVEERTDILLTTSHWFKKNDNLTKSVYFKRRGKNLDILDFPLSAHYKDALSLDLKFDFRYIMGSLGDTYNYSLDGSRSFSFNNIGLGVFEFTLSPRVLYVLADNVHVARYKQIEYDFNDGDLEPQGDGVYRFRLVQSPPEAILEHPNLPHVYDGTDFVRVDLYTPTNLTTDRSLLITDHKSDSDMKVLARNDQTSPFADMFPYTAVVDFEHRDSPSMRLVQSFFGVDLGSKWHLNKSFSIGLLLKCRYIPSTKNLFGFGLDTFDDRFAISRSSLYSFSPSVRFSVKW